MAWFRLNRSVGILLASLSFVMVFQIRATAQESSVMQMPQSRFGMCSARIGSKLYLIGGATGAQSLLGISQGIRGVTGMVSVYDYATETWDTAAPLSTPRVFATAAAIGDSIYVMGGMDDQDNSLNSMEVYDPDKNEWNAGAPMLRYRVGAASVVYANSILVFGGGGIAPLPALGSVGNPLGVLHKLVEEYSPMTGSWTSLDSISPGRAFAQVVKLGRYVYILGGLGVIGALNVVERYLPDSGRVDRRYLLSNGRYFFGAVELKDSLYALSGLEGGQDYLSSFYSGVDVMPVGSDGEEVEPENRSLMISHPRASFVVDVGPDSSIYLFGGLSPFYGHGTAPDPYVARISPTAVTAVSSLSASPQTFNLDQNYPNPFNPTTKIEFEVPEPGMDVNLEVFNLVGEKVATLASGYLSPGQHSVIFNGANYASGVYIYKLSKENGSIYRKMVLIK